MPINWAVMRPLSTTRPKMVFDTVAVPSTLGIVR